MQIVTIPLAEIAAPSLYRSEQSPEKLQIAELAASIERQNLLQPLVLRPATEDEAPAKFAVIAGRRRLAALKMLKWTEAPCVIREQDEVASFLDEVAENLHRQDPSLADTARAVRLLMAVYDDQRTVAKSLSKSPAWVSKHLSLTSSKTPESIKGLMDQELVTDLETLLLLRQLHDLSPAKYPRQPGALARCMRLAVTGVLSRATARDELARARDPEPAATTTTRTTGQTVTTTQHAGQEEEAQHDPRTHFTVALPIDLLQLVEAQGGPDALVALIKANSESQWLPPAQA